MCVCAVDGHDDLEINIIFIVTFLRFFFCCVTTGETAGRDMMVLYGGKGEFGGQFYHYGL